ncbi:MAG: DNA repair protein RadA [Desulfovermiculus sp.]
MKPKSTERALDMKNKKQFECQNCGARSAQWQGQCPRCGQWGTVAELEDAAGSRVPSAPGSRPADLDQISMQGQGFLPTGSGAFDAFLGQGLMQGSVVLLGGAPGMGKSTFLLQLMGSLQRQGLGPVYISGEESLGQIKQRAERLGLRGHGLMAMSSTRLEDVLASLSHDPVPQVLMVDSVQTMISSECDGDPGSVSQVRTVTAALIEEAKARGVSIILVGHVTKDGQIAGPKLLEHMVDAVLSLEGDGNHDFRILRVVKNRFGPTSNILVLKMVHKGLQVVHDPSTFFLQARDPSLSGSALVMALEGQRPLAVEVQALVTESFGSLPRRTSVGFDSNRLNLLLAIVEKRLHLRLGAMDVYAKIGGGLKMEEPGMDLGLVAAVLSSSYDRPLPEGAVFWGEVDLSGQVRPIAGHELRMKQAASLAYSPVVCPAGGRQSETELPSGPDLMVVQNIQDMGRFFAAK